MIAPAVSRGGNSGQGGIFPPEASVEKSLGVNMREAFLNYKLSPFPNYFIFLALRGFDKTPLKSTVSEEQNFST